MDIFNNLRKTIFQANESRQLSDELFIRLVTEIDNIEDNLELDEEVPSVISDEYKYFVSFIAIEANGSSNSGTIIMKTQQAANTEQGIAEIQKFICQMIGKQQVAILTINELKG